MKLKALFIGLFVVGLAFSMQAQANKNQVTRKGAPAAQAAIQQKKQQAKADGKITPKERIEMKATQKKASKAVARRE